MAEILPIRRKTLSNQSINPIESCRYMAEILRIRRKTPKKSNLQQPLTLYVHLNYNILNPHSILYIVKINPI